MVIQSQPIGRNRSAEKGGVSVAIRLRRAIAIIVAAVILVAVGTVFAAGIYGTYRGFNIVKVTVDGREVRGDVPAVNLDGRTMVPLRFVSEALGATADWDQASYTAIIRSRAAAQGMKEGFHVSDASVGIMPAIVLTKKDIYGHVPGQGMVFLEVGLLIKNFSQSEIWISPEAFPVMIGEQKYSFISVTMSNTARLVPRSLKPGDVAFGIIIYEVPEGASYHVATGHMLYSSQVLKVPLAPKN
jgi:hypothetical protein